MQRLDDTIERASRPDVDPEEIRVHGALIGAGIDQVVFETAAYSSGRLAGLAVELDCAARLLPWRDRFDAREGTGGGGVIRAALSAATAALAQAPDDRDRARIDRQLQDQFIDTQRYRDGDWVAWLASRATDCAYAAVGSAFGKPSAPSAIAELRAAAVDLAAIARGMLPWDLEATLRTEVDAAVLDELGAQHRALDAARRNVAG